MKDEERDRVVDPALGQYFPDQMIGEVLVAQPSQHVRTSSAASESAPALVSLRISAALLELVSVQHWRGVMLSLVCRVSGVK